MVRRLQAMPRPPRHRWSRPRHQLRMTLCLPRRPKGAWTVAPRTLGTTRWRAKKRRGPAAPAAPAILTPSHGARTSAARGARTTPAARPTHISWPGRRRMAFHRRRCLLSRPVPRHPRPTTMPPRRTSGLKTLMVRTSCNGGLHGAVVTGAPLPWPLPASQMRRSWLRWRHLRPTQMVRRCCWRRCLRCPSGTAAMMGAGTMATLFCAAAR